MLIETSRFGTVEVDGEKLITFRDGLLGFPGERRFALIQTSPDPVFFWLQAVEDPQLAFVVCDPRTFFEDYQVPVRKDDMDALGMQELADNQVLAIVNRAGDDLTANLLGPIVICTSTLLARQLVLSDKRYTTRHRIMPMPSVAQAAAAKSA